MIICAALALPIRTARCLSVMLALLSAGGCAAQPRIREPVSTRPFDQQVVLEFDTDRDGRLDYWQYQNNAGRVVALSFNSDIPGRPGPRIELDRIDVDDVPHFILVLDGVPFDVIADLQRAGQFRLFHKPSRVICCYPAMTDLCLNELFHAGQSAAFQARHYDPQRNKLVEGNSAYLGGDNSPWVAKMAYRASFWWDVKVYLDPQAVFDHELSEIGKTFGEVQSGEAAAYSVGTAGLGTRGGRAAIEKYLKTIDEYCERVLFERRGRAKFTIVADHGHNLVKNDRIRFDDLLKRSGYRFGKSLRGERDVVEVAYGLVTYAEFHTRDAYGVAHCVMRHPNAEFAAYRDGDTVVLCNVDGEARIRRGQSGWYYDLDHADPLHLRPIIDELRAAGHVATDGAIDDRALFDATIAHEYPDPLRRLWRALHDLVACPPDVIVNLRDGACHGSGFFHTMLGEVTSTHGSLNRMNSTTFVLSMLGELPPALRSEEVLPALEKLR